MDKEKIERIIAKEGPILVSWAVLNYSFLLNRTVAFSSPILLKIFLGIIFPVCLYCYPPYLLIRSFILAFRTLGER